MSDYNEVKDNLTGILMSAIDGACPADVDDISDALTLIEQQQARIAELEHQVTIWMLEALTPPKGAIKMNDLKTIIKLAAQVVLFRNGDVSTEDGDYATTDCDNIIHLEESLTRYFNLDSDDITFKNINELIRKIDEMPNIEQQHQRITELGTEVNEAVKEKDMEHYHRRAVDEENETLKARVMEYERLHRELATTLEHDAESPSLCDLVAVARTISKERDALKAHAEQLCAALKHLHHNAKASGAEMGLALDVAEEALQLTPQQSLAERDYTIAYNAFHAGVVYADTVPKGTGDTPGAANEYAKSIKDVE